MNLSFLTSLTQLPLGWTVAVVAMGYVIVVLKRSDSIQESRLSDYKEMLQKYQDLLSKLGDK
jgi:hypothetical protein